MCLAAIMGLIMNGLSVQAQEKNKHGTDQIPTKVLDGLKAKFPKPEIDKWTKEKEGEVFMYDIEFKQGGKKIEADIKEDGTLDNWEKVIPINDLPAAVKMTVDKKYPKASLQEVSQTVLVKDGRDQVEGYEILLRTNDKKDVEITVATDGKILEDSTTKK